MQDALGGFELELFGCRQSDMGGIALSAKGLFVEPGKLKAEGAIAADLVLHICKHRQDVVLQPELYAEQRPDAFGQSEVPCPTPWRPARP
jgi:hypothetical protein